MDPRVGAGRLPAAQHLSGHAGRRSARWAPSASSRASPYAFDMVPTAVAEWWPPRPGGAAAAGRGVGRPPRPSPAAAAGVGRWRAAQLPEAADHGQSRAIVGAAGSSSRVPSASHLVKSSPLEPGAGGAPPPTTPASAEIVSAAALCLGDFYAPPFGNFESRLGRKGGAKKGVPLSQSHKEAISGKKDVLQSPDYSVDHC
jgi:hypothetical protein